MDPSLLLPEGIRFRVKVTSVTEPGKGQLLAAVNRNCSSHGLDGGQESLLPVRPDDTLGQEVFRLIFDDGVVLLINDRYWTVEGCFHGIPHSRPLSIPPLYENDSHPHSVEP